jgi:hypothetical protein
MNCTKIRQKKNSSPLGKAMSFGSSRLSEREIHSCTIGTALTNYKRVVDIDKTLEIQERHKILHYGLSSADLEAVQTKLKKQKQFLEFSFLYDRINQTKIPLADIMISANHAPNRYYAEIQNRVNTLTTVAKER